MTAIENQRCVVCLLGERLEQRGQLKVDDAAEVIVRALVNVKWHDELVPARPHNGAGVKCLVVGIGSQSTVARVKDEGRVVSGTVGDQALIVLEDPVSCCVPANTGTRFEAESRQCL